MAIIITEEYMNHQTDKPSDMKTTISRSSNDNVSQRATVDFHKHCQQTICSAWGYDGQGMTREILMPMPEDDDLQYLKKFILPTEELSTWQAYFKRNQNNITQDLRAILELMNKLAGNIVKSWTLKFKDNNNHEICEQEINPWTDTSTTYTLSGFGRDIELDIDGNQLKFNTIKQFDEDWEQLSIKLEKKDLTVNFNGQLVGTVSSIYMEQESELDINQDYNLLPTSEYVDVEQGGVVVNGSHRIYRYYANNSNTAITPIFTLDQKYTSSIDDSYPPVVEWEFHLMNNDESNNLGVNDPIVKIGDDVNYFRYVALTDQMYVEPGKTNVYVFRAEMHSSVLTYSLAYVY